MQFILTGEYATAEIEVDEFSEGLGWVARVPDSNKCLAESSATFKSEAEAAIDANAWFVNYDAETGKEYEHQLEVNKYADNHERNRL